MDDLNLSALATDALGEFTNIGAANAATSLSQILKHQVDVDPPRVELRKIEDVIEFVGAPDDVMSIVLVKVLGDAPGVMMLLFPQEDAKKIAHLMTKRQEEPLINEQDRSALCEVGNILAGSCFSSLSSFLNLSFTHSIPNFATDMVGALLSSILAEFGEEHEAVLNEEVQLHVRDLDVHGSVYFLFDPDATKKIVEATEKKLPS